MKKRHELKTWPDPFRAVWERRKTAEFRKDDRAFWPDDELLLKEFDPDTGEYSGREILVTVTHIVNGPSFGIPDGYAMLSFRPEWRGGPDQWTRLG